MDVITLLKAAVLGLVEGVTEFIPVSSTGHLILVQSWLGLSGDRKWNAFIIFIQLPAILAVVWLYRKKIIDVVRGLRTEPPARRLTLSLILATLPAAIIGIPTEDWVERNLFRPFPVALALVLGGVAILLIERFFTRPRIDDVDAIPVKTAVGIGFMQVLAMIFPGVSRSGATIMGGMTLGLSRKAATEFSFFLAIPAMLGASIIKMKDIVGVLTPADLPVFAVGSVVSFLSALVVIRALIRYVSSNTFAPFAWYRIVFGIILIVLYWNRQDAFQEPSLDADAPAPAAEAPAASAPPTAPMVVAAR
ncbi:MAG TPA: undecaprenyl-diphosphate phosphatase [Longimicrobium sp.]|nr:undecaprenyl-diphosphate phosphatase [Longimicrobium sp.]